MSALKRIKKELDEIQKNPPLEISLGPTDDNNLFHWEGVLNGPEESPYGGGVFKFAVDFPLEYPMKPPTVRFLTRVYHPNISRNGEICIDILKKHWSSVLSISQVILSISSLLTDPNCDSPFNPESAQLYRTDRKAFNKTVRDWVKKYARPENL